MRDLVLGLLFGALGLGLIFRTTGGRVDVHALRQLRLSCLLLCLGLVVLDWVLEAGRMWLLGRALGEPIRVASVLRAVFLGAFVSRITPFDTGGEPVQVYALSREGMSVGRATAVVTVKAIVHFLARLCLGIVVPVWAILTARGWSLGPLASAALWTGMSVYLVVLVCGLLLLLNSSRYRAFLVAIIGWRPLRGLAARFRLESALERFDEHHRMFSQSLRQLEREKRATVALVAAMSVTGWAAVLAVPVVLVRALGGVSPAAEVAATAIIFYIAIAYAPTPGSSGASEIGFAALFAPFVPRPVLGVLVLAWRLLTHYVGLVVGMLVTTFSVTRGHVQAAARGAETPHAPARSGGNP